MNKKETEIAELRKYLNGELDAKAMHRFEQKALDDPFLMDALEGYEISGGVKQPPLSELNERLQQRSTPNNTVKMFPWRWVGIAALVLVVLGIAGIFIMRSQKPNAQLASRIIENKITPQKADTQLSAIKTDTVKPAIAKGEYAANNIGSKRPDAATTKQLRPVAAAPVKTTRQPAKDTAADATPLNEMIVMGYAASDKTKTAGAADEKLGENNPAGNSMFGKAAFLQKKIKGRIIGKDNGQPIIGASVRLAGSNTAVITDLDGNFSIPADGAKNKLLISYIGYAPQVVEVPGKDSIQTIAMLPSGNALGELAINKTHQLKKDTTAYIANEINRKLNSKAKGVSVNVVPMSQQASPYQQSLIMGRVISADDGQPIPGASVKIAGTAEGIQTDVNGNFKIRGDSSRSKLSINFVGYQPKQVSARNRDSLQNIRLMPSSSSLSEVVVTSYSAQRSSTADTVNTNAHPKAGWASFRKYLKDNAISPDGKKGTVKLTFTVNSDGTISDIKIAKGISIATDQKAVELLNNGPDWEGAKSGNPENVSIRVSFIK